MATIYSELRYIEFVSNSVDINKKYKKIFDEYDEQNGLVNQLVKGDKNILDIVSELSKEYQYWKTFFPIHNDGEKFYKKYNEIGLDKILYPLDIKTFERWKPINIDDTTENTISGVSFRTLRFINYMLNPYTVNATTGGILGLVSGVLSSQDPLLTVLTTFTCSFVAHTLSAFPGCGGWYNQIGGIAEVVDSAKYLQDRIDEYILDKNEKVLK